MQRFGFELRFVYGCLKVVQMIYHRYMLETGQCICRNDTEQKLLFRTRTRALWGQGSRKLSWMGYGCWEGEYSTGAADKCRCRASSSQSEHDLDKSGGYYAFPALQDQAARFFRISEYILLHVSLGFDILFLTDRAH